MDLVISIAALIVSVLSFAYVVIVSRDTMANYKKVAEINRIDNILVNKEKRGFGKFSDFPDTR